MKLNATFLIFFVLLVLNIPHTFGETPTAKSYAPAMACNGFTYCGSFGNSQADEWIAGFSFADIDNDSDGSMGGYSDFTTISTDVTIGESYAVTCTPGFDGFTYTEVWRIWIDLNQDGDFDDANELIFNPEGSDMVVESIVGIPINALPGITTMRVSMKFNSEATSCEEGFSFGEVEDYCVNIIEGNGCYQTILDISDITDVSALASWPAITLAESYNVRYREVGTTDWLELNTSAESITLDLEGCLFYEVQVETVCGGGLSSGYTLSSEFITFGCGNCLDQTYCTVEDANSFNTYIDNITLNTMNSTSGDDGGFGDYTGPFTTSLEQGLSYTLTTTAVPTGYGQDVYYTAYIDFNADGDFDDPFELIMNSQASLEELSFSQTFPVPPTAVEGTTRLRVFIQNFNFNDEPTDPCVTFLNGEAEDYCIEITAGTGCYLPLETAVLDNFGESILIGWEDGLVAEGFSIRYREIGIAAWTEINGITGNMYELMDLTECNDYEFQIQTNCVGISTAWSNSIQVKTFGCGSCYDFSYCEVAANNSNDDWIGSVEFGDMNNVSGNNGGYINFEDDFGLTVRPDSTYNLTLTPEWPGTMFQVSWRVWIDYDANGTFEDSEIIFEAPTSAELFQTASVTIPIDAAFGLTKMRVIMREQAPTGPCESFTYGEVEDYCITILPQVLPCTAPPSLDTTNVGTTSIDMLWSPDQYDAAIGYLLRLKKISETDWMEFSTSITSFQAFGLEACTDYEYQVRSICSQDFSDYGASFNFTTSCNVGTEDLTNARNINSLNLYPNPFTEKIMLDFELKKASQVSLKLLSISGQLIQVQTIDALGVGSHHLELSPDQIAAGVYMVQLATEDEVVIRKVVKN